MSISENIAKYRKKKGYTQEKLGEILGVTNQTVSKWESAVSMPDVMLMPKIADALGITLEGLYGLKTHTDDGNKRVSADRFPTEANKMLIEYFREQSGIAFRADQLEDPWVLVCVSDHSGAAHISNGFSLIDRDYKSPESERIFKMDEIASAMSKLSDGKVRAVIAYMYQRSFNSQSSPCEKFLISEVSAACGFSKDEVSAAVEKMLTLNLLERIVNDDKVTEYYFIKSRAFYALTVFKAVELLIRSSLSYEVVRDTSQITDYAFEKLW